MITLIGTILGFFSSAIPEILKLIRDKSDKKHELAILDRQMELQKAGLSQRLEEIKIQADAIETIAIRTPDQLTGVSFIDGLCASVRPCITYLFMFAYLAVKIAQYQMLTSIHYNIGTNFSNIVPLLWNPEDEVIFATILGFWFGGRMLEKFQKRRR